MPRYKLQAPDGRTVTIEGDQPPSEQELDEIFAALPAAEKPAPAATEAPAAGAAAAPPVIPGRPAADLLKGAALEAPLVTLRAAAVPQNITGAAIRAGLRMLGMNTLADKMEAQEADLRSTIEAPFLQGADASTAEKLGRLGMRAAPQVALAAATGGTSLPVQAAVQGAAGAAQTASEGGSAGDVALSGALNAAAPGAGKVLGKAVAPAGAGLKSLAVIIYEKALNPGKEAMKELAERTAPRMIEEGIHAGVGGWRKIKGLSFDEMKRLGREVQATYEAAKAAGAKMSGGQLADALEALKAPFIRPAVQTKQVVTGALDAEGNPITKTVKEVVDVVQDDQAVNTISRIQDKLRSMEEADPEAIWNYRKLLDSVVAKTNGFTKKLMPNDLKKLSKRARTLLQDRLTAIVKATPATAERNIEKLNDDFGFWKDVHSILYDTLRRKTGQERTMELLVKGGAGSIGGAIGYKTDGTEGAVKGVLAGAAITQMLRSPFVRTWTATHLNTLADMMIGNAKALETPIGQEIATALALFGVKATVKPGTARSAERTATAVGLLRRRAPEAPDDSVSQPPAEPPEP